MSNDEQQRFGDGQDDDWMAAQKAAEAFKKASAISAKSANTAAAVIKAGAEGGKAAAEIAAGTAAGGLWGAALSAVWSMRHTLFKVLVSICLFLLFIAVVVTSLPSIVVDYMLQPNQSNINTSAPTELTANYNDLSAVVSGCIPNGYRAAYARVEQIITEGGYDRTRSMESLSDNAQLSTDCDICYTLAAYSASMQQRGTSKADMKAKLDAVCNLMFAVTYEVKTDEVPAQLEQGASPSGSDTADSEPQVVTVKYAVCTIHPFNQSVILTAFGINASSQYGQFDITYGEAITNMSNALKMTVYGIQPAGALP